MKLKSEVIGGVVTAIYLVGIALLVYLKRDSLQTLELNSIGDFLAGVFGPIAFLWLVLGYLQQGRELKISSDALLMQVEELRRTGEQQAHLVSVGREQINAQIDANNHERLRYEKSMNAHILFYPHARVGMGDLFTHTFEIHNAGSDAFDLQLMSKLPGNNVHSVSSVLRRDETVKVPFVFERVKEDFSTILHCFYKTIDGRRVGFQMDLSISTNDQKISITSIIKIEDL